MYKQLIFLLLLIFFSSNSYSSPDKDKLKCSTFIKFLETEEEYSILMYRQMTQSVIEFNHNLVNNVITEMKKRQTENFNLGEYIADSFFTTHISLQMLSINYVVERCKKDPSRYLEAIGRVSYLATQKTLPNHKDMNWEYIQSKQARKDLSKLKHKQ